MATLNELDNLIQQMDKPKETDSSLGKTAASYGRTIGGGVVGGTLDLLQLPQTLYHAYKGTEGPKSYSDRIREKIDEVTGGYTKPEEGSTGHKVAGFISELLGPGATIKKGAGLAAKGVGQASKAYKTLKKVEQANKLTPKNIAILGGSTAGGMAGASLLPEERERDSLLNILYPLLGSVVGGATAGRSVSRRFLNKTEKDALNLAKDAKSAPKWSKRLDIDLDKLQKDQALGIQGTLGDYSKRNFIKTHEFSQRRHPTAGKYYRNLEEQQLAKYKEHFGLDRPEITPSLAGDYIKKATQERQTEQSALFDKLYKEIKKAVPSDAVIDESYVKGKVGSHIFEEVNKLSPSEKIAKLDELIATPYLKRLAKAAADISGGEHLQGVPNHIKESIKNLSSSDQKAVLKQLGIKSIPSSLEESIGATKYHDLKSIHESLRAKTKSQFGLISDKNPAGAKHLSHQLGDVENSFLENKFPELYKKKKSIDSKYDQYKTKEVPIINDLLGSKMKEVSPERAFQKVTNKAHTEPAYLTQTQEYLSPAENEVLSIAAIKKRGSKGPEGTITTTGFAKAFNSLDPNVKNIYLSGISNRKSFTDAIDSILSRKALQNLENNSGTSHFEQHHGLLKRGVHAVTELRQAKFKPLIHFLAGDLVFPDWQARKIFTNQDFLHKLNKFANAKNLSENVKYGQQLMANSGFKSLLKESTLKTPLVADKIYKHSEKSQAATVEQLDNLIDSIDRQHHKKGDSVKNQYEGNTYASDGSGYGDYNAYKRGGALIDRLKKKSNSRRLRKADGGDLQPGEIDPSSEYAPSAADREAMRKVGITKTGKSTYLVGAQNGVDYTDKNAIYGKATRLGQAHDAAKAKLELAQKDPLAYAQKYGKTLSATNLAKHKAAQAALDAEDQKQNDLYRKGYRDFVVGDPEQSNAAQLKNYLNPKQPEQIWKGNWKSKGYSKEQVLKAYQDSLKQPQQRAPGDPVYKSQVAPGYYNKQTLAMARNAAKLTPAQYAENQAKRAQEIDAMKAAQYEDTMGSKQRQQMWDSPEMQQYASETAQTAFDPYRTQVNSARDALSNELGVSQLQKDEADTRRRWINEFANADIGRRNREGQGKYLKNDSSAWDALTGVPILGSVVKGLNTVTGGVIRKGTESGENFGKGNIGAGFAGLADAGMGAAQFAMNPVSSTVQNVGGALAEKYLPQILGPMMPQDQSPGEDQYTEAQYNPYNSYQQQSPYGYGGQSYYSNPDEFTGYY